MRLAVFGRLRCSALPACALRENGIALDPHLLPGWTEMAFPVQWRGRLLRLRLEADPRRIEVDVESGDELTARGARRARLPCSSLAGAMSCDGDESGWGNWEEVGR